MGTDSVIIEMTDDELIVVQTELEKAVKRIAEGILKMDDYCYTLSSSKEIATLYEALDIMNKAVSNVIRSTRYNEQSSKQGVSD